MTKIKTAFLSATGAFLMSVSAYAQIRSEGKHLFMDLTLTPAMIDKSKKPVFRPDGQFQLQLPKSEFPVPAPHCKKNILLRMPSSVYDPSRSALEKEEKERKKKVFDEIMAVIDLNSGDVKVEVDLAPYAKVVSRDPLTAELEFCNVFFSTRFLRAPN